MFERKKTTKYVKTLFQYKTTVLNFHYRVYWEETHKITKQMFILQKIASLCILTLEIHTLHVYLE